MNTKPTTIQFKGQAGLIDAAIDWPDQDPIGWALCLHPHPLYQGARNNKVVTTMSRALQHSGYVTVRPDFRGVGKSEGEFDKGHGETLDMLELVKQFSEQFPDLASKPWYLTGFSFGTAVAAQLHNELEDAGMALPEKLLLAGTAVWRFKYREVKLPDTVRLIHGSEDETVPMSETIEWLEQYHKILSVLPGATHFFHGYLIELKDWTLAQINA